MPTKTIINVDTKQVTTSEMTDAEIASQQETTARKAHGQREKRDNLLSHTDWTQGADVPTSIKSKWTDYRQKLRDVPAQSGFPDSVTWPTEPS